MDAATIRAKLLEGLSGVQCAAFFDVPKGTFYGYCFDVGIRISNRGGTHGTEPPAIATEAPPSLAAIRLAEFDPLMAKCLRVRAGFVDEEEAEDAPVPPRTRHYHGARHSLGGRPKRGACASPSHFKDTHNDQ